jgi:hypothetical protein
LFWSYIVGVVTNNPHYVGAGSRVVTAAGMAVKPRTQDGAGSMVVTAAGMAVRRRGCGR